MTRRIGRLNYTQSSSTERFGQLLLKIPAPRAPRPENDDTDVAHSWQNDGAIHRACTQIATPLCARGDTAL